MAFSRTGVQFICKVLIGNKGTPERLDDTEFKVLEWEYEDSEASNDKLKLKLNNFNLTNFDTPKITIGNGLQFSFGYEGNMSPTYEAIITKVKGFHILEVEALSKGCLMNRLRRKRIFENMTRSEVVKQIAEENGYTGAQVDIEDTTEKVSQITQPNLTDAQFIRDLARREGFQFYVDVTGLHFHKRRVDQKPVAKLYWYLDGSGTIKGYPTLEADPTHRPTAVTTTVRDKLKKTDPKAVTSTTADSDRSGLAPTEALAAKVSDTGELERNPLAFYAGGHDVATTEKTEAAAKRQVQGALANSQSGQFKFKLPCVGDPRLGAKVVVELSGVGQLLSGNYYVTKATHKGKGEYDTELEVRRNGVSGQQPGGGAAAGKVNTGKGPSGDANEADKLEAKKVINSDGSYYYDFFDTRGQQKGGGT